MAVVETSVPSEASWRTTKALVVLIQQFFWCMYAGLCFNEFLLKVDYFWSSYEICLAYMLERNVSHLAGTMNQMFSTHFTFLLIRHHPLEWPIVGTFNLGGVYV